MSARSRLRAIVLGIGCTTMAAATLFTGPAAVAAPTAATGQQYCTFAADTGRSGCFATQEQAVLMMSDGKTSDERNLTQSSGKIIVGKFFRDRNYGGPTWTVTFDKLCNPADGKINIVYTFPKDWRHQITSVEAYGNCKIWLYPQPHLQGRRDGPFLNNVPYVGDYINDRTASVGFS